MPGSPAFSMIKIIIVFNFFMVVICYSFFLQLKIPVLYLASLTHRASQKDLMEDVYSYMKDRYFIGETVEVCFQENKWFVYTMILFGLSFF